MYELKTENQCCALLYANTTPIGKILESAELDSKSLKYLLVLGFDTGFDLADSVYYCANSDVAAMFMPPEVAIPDGNYFGSVIVLIPTPQSYPILETNLVQSATKEAEQIQIYKTLVDYNLKDKKNQMEKKYLYYFPLAHDVKYLNNVYLRKSMIKREHTDRPRLTTQSNNGALSATNELYSKYENIVQFYMKRAR